MKWPLLTEFQMLRLCSDHSDDDERRCREILKVLCEIDSNHKGYYEELLLE